VREIVGTVAGGSTLHAWKPLPERSRHPDTGLAPWQRKEAARLWSGRPSWYRPPVRLLPNLKVRRTAEGRYRAGGPARTDAQGEGRGRARGEQRYPDRKHGPSTSATGP